MSDDEPSVITDSLSMHSAKRLKIEGRKLDGMQRELYSLIGENQPPVVLTNNTKFKSRPEWQQKPTPWAVAEFEPKSGLKIKHWVRAAAIADGTSGDRFGKYNTEVSVPSFTDADYKQFDDDDWSLEETRYLFDLAKEYDLRWFVIHDRYNYKPRSLEDLKQRYYSVCSKLLKMKDVVKEMGLSPHDEELLRAMQFDADQEVKRKQHLTRLLSRNPADVAEEEALILEARRLESISSRIAAERQELLNLLETPQSLTSKIKHEVSSSHGVGQLIQELQSEKGRKGQSNQQIKQVAQTVSKAIHRKLSEREIIAYGIAYTDDVKVKHSGVYVRSAKLTQIRQNVLPKVKAVLTELGLPLKPVMPTARMCQLYETLYQQVNVLLDAKKLQDKVEMEGEIQQ